MGCNQSSLARATVVVDATMEPPMIGAMAAEGIVPQDDEDAMEEGIVASPKQWEDLPVTKLKDLPFTVKSIILGCDPPMDKESLLIITAWHRRQLVESAQACRREEFEIEEEFCLRKMEAIETQRRTHILALGEEYRAAEERLPLEEYPFGGFDSYEAASHRLAQGKRQRLVVALALCRLKFANAGKDFCRSCEKAVHEEQERIQQAKNYSAERIAEVMNYDLEPIDLSSLFPASVAEPPMGALPAEEVVPSAEVMSPLEDLPEAVHLKILSFVPLATAISIMGTNRRFRNLLLSSPASHHRWVLWCGKNPASWNDFTAEQHEEYRAILKRLHESEKATLVRVAEFAMATMTTGAEEAIQNGLDQELQKARGAFLRQVFRSVVCQKRATQQADADL